MPESCPRPHQVSAEIETVACELRRDHPRWGPLRLAHELAGKGVVPAPSRMSVYRVLVRHGLVEPEARKLNVDPGGDLLGLGLGDPRADDGGVSPGVQAWYWAIFLPSSAIRARAHHDVQHRRGMLAADLGIRLDRVAEKRTKSANSRLAGLLPRFQ